MRPGMASPAQDDDIPRYHGISRSNIADFMDLKGMEGIFLPVKFTPSTHGMLQLMPILLSEGLDEPPDTGKDRPGPTHDLRLAGEI